MPDNRQHAARPPGPRFPGDLGPDTVVDGEKITVNLSVPSTRAMLTVMRLRGQTKTEVVNRAVQVLAYLEKAWADGGEVLVRADKGGEPERLRIL